MKIDSIPVEIPSEGDGLGAGVNQAELKAVGGPAQCRWRPEANTTSRRPPLRTTSSVWRPVLLAKSFTLTGGTSGSQQWDTPEATGAARSSERRRGRSVQRQEEEEEKGSRRSSCQLTPPRIASRRPRGGYKRRYFEQLANPAGVEGDIDGGDVSSEEEGKGEEEGKEEPWRPALSDPYQGPGVDFEEGWFEEGSKEEEEEQAPRLSGGPRPSTPGGVLGGDPGGSGPSGFGGGLRRRELLGALAGLNDEMEPPLHKRALKRPGSVMEILVNHARSQLEGGVESRWLGGPYPGGEDQFYFNIVVKPTLGNAINQKRELHHLSAAVDVLRQGELSALGDLLSAGLSHDLTSKARQWGQP